jgi:AcrR family transcriptional regulator
VLQAVTAQYLSGERVDLTVVARGLGLSRATIYRWFGSREHLLGEVVATQLEQVIARKRRAVCTRGAPGLLEVFDQINRSLSRAPALRTLIEQEPATAMRILTSGSGVVHPRAVSTVRALILSEVTSGHYDPPADPETLAYAIVRLAEAFIYNDRGVRGDHARLREVQAALLGVAVAVAGGGRSPGQPAPRSAFGRLPR